MNNEVNNPMLVNVYYHYDRDTKTSECAYVTRINDVKFVDETDDLVDIYWGNDDYFDVRPIKGLKHDTIKTGFARFEIKRLQEQGFAVYAADIDIAIHKSIKWKHDHPNQGNYKLRINYIDIELFQKGYATMDFTNIPSSAEKIPINLITIYDNYLDTYFTLVYNLNNAKISEEQIRKNLEYSNDCKLDVRVFNTERELLLEFFKILRECDCDILTGWNTEGFDIPYIYFRSLYLGVSPMLSHNKKMSVYTKVILERSKYKKSKNENDEADTRTVWAAEMGYMVPLDYMPLYKKRSISIKENYKLDTIASLELGIKKLDVSEGMDDIFLNDPDRFIAYNINDVHLVRKLDDKLKYIDLCFNMVQFSNISWNSIYTTLKICDGILYDHLIKENKTVKVVKEIVETRKKDGAYVRNPIKGIHEYAGDLDATSMYPYIMARYNISADTYVGRFEDPEDAHLFLYDRDAFLKKDCIMYIRKKFGREDKLKIHPKALMDAIIKKGYIVTYVGTLFMKHEEKRSVLYDIIDMLIKMRKQYKDLMKANIGGNKMLYDRYDGMQKTIKIVTNSLYGGQANTKFRLYSYEVTESITGTGREMIKLAAITANRCINHMADVDTETMPKLNMKLSDIDEASGVLENVIYGDSVTGDSLIDTKEYGKISIENLYDVCSKTGTVVTFPGNRYEAMNYSIPVSVKNSQGNYVNIGNVMKHRTSKKLYRITDEKGNSVTVTEDHSIMIKRNNQLISIKPTDLLVGDVLVVDDDREDV